MTDKRVLLINPDGTAEVNGVKVRVVPAEPTHEQRCAAIDRETDKELSMYAGIYRAMLSAAAIDLSGLPVVPKPIAWRCDWHHWRQHPDHWRQYHDELDPLPINWDDDPPETVTALVALDAIGAPK